MREALLPLLCGLPAQVSDSVCTSFQLFDNFQAPSWFDDRKYPFLRDFQMYYSFYLNAGIAVECVCLPMLLPISFVYVPCLLEEDLNQGCQGPNVAEFLPRLVSSTTAMFVAQYWSLNKKPNNQTPIYIHLNTSCE